MNVTKQEKAITAINFDTATADEILKAADSACARCIGTDNLTARIAFTEGYLRGQIKHLVKARDRLANRRGIRLLDSVNNEPPEAPDAH